MVAWSDLSQCYNGACEMKGSCRHFYPVDSQMHAHVDALGLKCICGCYGIQHYQPTGENYSKTKVLHFYLHLYVINGLHTHNHQPGWWSICARQPPKCAGFKPFSVPTICTAWRNHRPSPRIINHQPHSQNYPQYSIYRIGELVHPTQK